MRRLVLSAVAAGALVLVGASGAAAHNVVVDTNPAADSVLTELPEEFVVTTNDELLVVGDNTNAFFLQVRDAAGMYYTDGCVRVEGDSAYTNAALGAAGEYTLTWQLVSIDGHTISDSISFLWEPGPVAELTTGWPEPVACGEEPSATGEPTASPTADPTTEPSAEESPAPEGEGEVDLVPIIVLSVIGVAVLVTITTLVVRRKP